MPDRYIVVASTVEVGRWVLAASTLTAKERLDQAAREGLIEGRGGKLTPPTEQPTPRGKKPVSDYITEDRERR